MKNSAGPASSIETAVAGVIREVRQRGDSALMDFTRQWDRVSLRPEDFRVPREAIRSADLSGPFARAFRKAVDRIRKFHKKAVPLPVKVFDPGEKVNLELRWTPISSVGLYVPGGKASYPSTLAMCAIPAQVAGVTRIAVVSPPGPGGEVSPEVLLAARILGIEEVYRVGGAQAVAALALGTRSIPRVDKIFGPGNAFVVEAKRQLYGSVGIDLLAGPSEIVVYADDSADPEWVAADLMAQAEHDESARPMLIASTKATLTAVRAALLRRLEEEPRREIIRIAMEKNGVFEVVPKLEDAARRINEIAPEHLSIQSKNPRELLAGVLHAGAIYLGGTSPVALGDYYAGPNHVLPTGTAARYASCLSVADFMKRSSVIEVAAEFLEAHGKVVEILAEGEQLPAHAASIRVRTDRAGQDGVSGSSGVSCPEPRVRPGLEAAKAYDLVEETAEIKLNQNESPWDIVEELKDRILNRMRQEPWHRYPQKLPEELRLRIARDEGFSQEGVRVANGSNLLLQWLFAAYGGPGRVALVPRPSFSLYNLWGQISETEVVEYRLGPQLEYQVDELEDLIRDRVPALIVLCLPNNPTGSELQPGDVRRIARTAQSHGGLVVVDEAYREFSDPDLDRTQLARQMQNVVLLRTFSKAFAAAGIRLGYLLAPPAVGGNLAKLVPPFHLSLFAAVAGLALWDERESFQAQVKKIVNERDRLQKVLAALPGLEILPSQANFFLIRVADAAAVFTALRKRGVLLRQLGDDPGLLGLLRVSVGTPEENERLVQEMDRILKGR